MLKFIFTSEGRIAYNATNDFYEFIYDVKDYLGNTRVSFKPTAARNEIMQEDHYYPFGMKMAGLSRVTGSPETKFTYNGKELEDDFNLNWYHYGARYYDPQLGRWQQVDPADEFHSPYVYCANSPIIFIDPDGENIAYWVEERGAGGQGHAQLYYQNGEGQWYMFESGMVGVHPEVVSGSMVEGEARNVPVEFGDIPEGAIFEITSKVQDELITISAQKIAGEHNDGTRQYNLFKNNCLDAAVDVVNESGAGLMIRKDTVRPNTWFDDAKENGLHESFWYFHQWLESSESGE